MYFNIFVNTCCLLQITMILCFPLITSSAFWSDERSCGHVSCLIRTRIYGLEFTPFCYVYLPRLYENIFGPLPLILFLTLNKQYRHKQYTQFYSASYSYPCLLNLFYTNPGIRNTIDYLSFLLLVTAVCQQILSVSRFFFTYRLVYQSITLLPVTLGLFRSSPFHSPL